MYYNTERFWCQNNQPRVFVLGSISPQLRETVARITLAAPMMSCGASLLRLLLWKFFDPHGQKHIRENLPLKHLRFILPLPPTTTTTHYYSP